MERKKCSFMCIVGIFLFSIGIGAGIYKQCPEKAASDSPGERSERAVPELPKQVRLKPPEETALNPERVLFRKPTAVLNGEEGKTGYRWGNDCVLVDGDMILLSCDCFFEEEGLLQKIFYLAEAPDYVPREVFRQDSLKGFEGGFPDFVREYPCMLERRLIRPRAVQIPAAAEYGSSEMNKQYIYELNGELYCLSADFQKTVFLCNIRELMGELYNFSPWTAEESICDVSADASRMLACTDRGLYEYDLMRGGERLLEPAVFLPYEIVHIEGDCDCGETGFEFSGPVAVEYAPDEQGYAFLTGNEYGDTDGITLKSGSGETLYQRKWEDFQGGFEWLESGDAAYLAVFYRKNGCTWMDQVNIHTGEAETFTVPDEVLRAGDSCVGFIDEDRMIYCSEYVSAAREQDGGWGKSQYQIYRLHSGEVQELKTISPDEADWRLILLRLGDYESVIVRYPQTGCEAAGAIAGDVKNQRNPDIIIKQNQ